MSRSGEILDDAAWEKSVGNWLPTREDRAEVAELMVPHYGAGDFAGWISRRRSVSRRCPVEHDYVRF